MDDLTDYTVPDYYPSFVCKCGACRHVCCHGWDIAVPMHEYFMLLGLDCPPGLRRKLDTALHMADNPRPERYALFNRRYDGGCPLHGEDGLCSLQKEMGEGAIPSVCRLYPRHHSNLYADECCCSGGCEETLELLFASAEKLHFLTDRQGERFESGAVRNPLIARRYREVRQKCLDIISDRKRRFPERLIGLGSFLAALEPAMKADDETAIRAALGADPSGADAPAGNEAEALSLACTLVRYFAETSPNLADYAEPAEAAFGTKDGEAAEDMPALYRAAAQGFEARYPDHELYFEKMFAHHIFYIGFPFADNSLNLRAAFSSLAAAYAVLRFTLLGALKETDGTDGLVDVCAAVFRMLESSSFHARAAMLLRRSRHDSPEQLNALIRCC